MSKKIVVLGSINVDLSTYTERFPVPNETIKGTQYVQSFGGKGANQAVAAAKLGGTVYMIGKLGNDGMANEYLKSFNDNHVDTTYVTQTGDVSTGIATIVVAEDGTNMIIIVGGANDKVTNADWQNAKSILDDADILLVQNEIPEEVSLAAVEAFKGISIWNAAPANEKSNPKLLTAPTIFCVNEIEAGVYSGVDVYDSPSIKFALDTLIQKGCNEVLLTCGNMGAFYMNKKDKSMIAVPTPQVKAVDATGAGDCFVGAFAYLLANRKDLDMEGILRLSCAVASDSVTRQGAQISYPGPEILNSIDIFPPGGGRPPSTNATCSAKKKKSCSYVEHMKDKEKSKDGQAIDKPPSEHEAASSSPAEPVEEGEEA